MTTCETILTNNSGGDVLLKLSNAGVHFNIATIMQGNSYSIKSEPNATYREYWVGTVDVEGGSPIIISSDDCLENEEIIIKKDSNVEMIKRGNSFKVFNKTDTEYKVNRRVGNGAPDTLATLKKGEECKIPYDPESKDCEYYVESSSSAQNLSIKSEDVVNNKKVDIINDSPGGNAKLQADPPTSTCFIL